MAQVAIDLQNARLHSQRYFTITALFIAILLIGFCSRLAAAATPGYGTVNLALGKPVTPLTGTVMGSIDGVNDGTATGYWYSYDSTSCTFLELCSTDDGHGYFYASFVIDLQAEYSIGRISINPSQNRGLRVLTSLDGTTWTERHKLDGFDTTGLVTASIGPVTFEPKGAYTARYVKYQGWAWWNQYVGASEFEVYEWKADSTPPPNIGTLTNIALGKQAVNTAGSVTAGREAFPNLTDGNPLTWWQPIYYFDVCQYAYNNSICPMGNWYNDAGSVYVDLGAPARIQAVRLIFPSGGPGTQSYTIDVSDDVSNSVPYKWWTYGGDPAVLASYPPVTSTTTQTLYPPSPIIGQFVWVSLNNSTTSQPFLPGLAEVEVYGDFTTAKTAPTVTVTPSASSITTIQPLAVTVAVNGGTGNPTPTGTVVLSSGSYASASTSLSSGQAIITIPAGSLAVGNDTLLATYTPDSSSTTYDSANGSGAVTVTAAPPVASLSSNSVSFSALIGTTSTTQTVVLSNTGGSALTISSISLSGTGASSFAQVNNCGSSVAAGASCNISMTFSPTAAGPFSATLSVADNASGTPHTASLSGAVISFKVTAAPTPQTLTVVQNVVAYAITVSAQNGTFPNAVTLAVSGVPSNIIASLSPASLTPGATSATSTLLLKSGATTTSSLQKPGGWAPLGIPALALIGIFVIPSRCRRRWLTLALLVCASLGALTAISGCGSTLKLSNITAGSYTLTVTGTSGSIQQTSSVQLNIQ